jgi:hypothetical protein
VGLDVTKVTRVERDSVALLIPLVAADAIALWSDKILPMGQ